MKPKKYPKSDLNRDSGLYFVIGLTLVLLLTWRALEYKSYDTIREQVVAYNIEPDLSEDVPITEAIKTPPPPAPPAAPVIIEVVEDVVEIEETVIQSTETSQDMEIEQAIMAVDEVEVGEEVEDITVPFSVIENVPVFPGCEEGTDKEKRECFQRMVQKHVVKHFRYPETAREMGVHGKVYVQFLIDEKGHVTNVRTRGPDQLLEKEAKRIIALLPQMTPGKQRGRAVKVPYSIPVTFKLM